MLKLLSSQVAFHAETNKASKDSLSEAGARRDAAYDKHEEAYPDDADDVRQVTIHRDGGSFK